MKTHTYKILLALPLILWQTNVLAQNTVSGTVSDAGTGEVLPSVNIKVKGTTNGTFTDDDGHYSLDVASLQDTLVFSFLGYKTRQAKIQGRTEITVALQPQSITGDEIVVIGYGTQKKSNVSSSVSTVSPIQLQENSVLPNAASALEGTTPGVSVTPSSGQPGAGINIRVRGSNTFGSNNPLVIIDGAPGNLNNVNPSDIASIQILKDAAAAAIYGSRAANGVVLVNTKNGHSGKTHIDAKYSYGRQYPKKLSSIANARQYAKIDNRLHRSIGIPVYDAFKNPSSIPKGRDWQDVVYNPAPMWNAFIGISGGTKDATYRVSGSFHKQEGIITSTSYQKSLLHFNGMQEAGPFEFGESISWTSPDQRLMPGGGDKAFPLNVLLSQPVPIIPIYDSDNLGGYGGAPAYLQKQMFNMLGLAKMQHNTNHDNNFRSNVYSQVEILSNLKFKIDGSYRVDNDYHKIFEPSWYMSPTRQNLYTTLNETRSRTHHWLVQGTLHYQKQVGQSTLNLLGGVSSEENHSRSVGTFAEGFPNRSLQVNDATTAHNLNVSGSDFRWNLLSAFGRMRYSYKDRYYATANVRRDGSSRFGRGNRYGWFPSGSIAWNMSNESFFNPLHNVINNFKIRASYGVLGNEPSSNYGYIPTITYTPNLGYLFGDSNYNTGAAQTQFSNPDIRWETTRDLDVGVDIRFLNSISFTIDYYNNKTNNVLLNVPIPPSTGTFQAPEVNTGRLRNKGFEFSLSYDSPTKNHKFNYDLTGHLSTANNEVLSLGYKGQVIQGNSTYRSSTVTAAKVGYPIGAFFIRQAKGIFQNENQVKNWTGKNDGLLQPNAKPGDIRYEDVNGDGLINSSDVAYSGSPFPDFTYGLQFNANYKNFDLSFLIQGTYGNKMFDTNTWIIQRGINDQNFSTALLNAWTPSNKDTDIPRLDFNDSNGNSLPSTRFLSDASYLRFKTVKVSYTLPKSLLSKYGISQLRIYIQGHNLWTISGYSGYDPSYTGDGLLNRGLDQGLYPIAKSISSGLEIKF